MRWMSIPGVDWAGGDTVWWSTMECRSGPCEASRA